MAKSFGNKNIDEKLTDGKESLGKSRGKVGEKKRELRSPGKWGTGITSKRVGGGKKTCVKRKKKRNNGGNESMRRKGWGYGGGSGRGGGGRPVGLEVPRGQAGGGGGGGVKEKGGKRVMKRCLHKGA